jgi:adenylate cyclase
MAFADAGQAVRFATKAQSTMAEDPDHWGGIRVRIGIHMGSSVRRGDDLFGRNVAMAARVAGQAHGGETLLSEAVRDSLGDANDVRFGPSREVELKGLLGAHALFPVVPAA